MKGEYLDALREVTARLPQVTEGVSHGATCFFVGDPLCYFHDHHGGPSRASGEVTVEGGGDWNTWLTGTGYLLTYDPGRDHG